MLPVQEGGAPGAAGRAERGRSAARAGQARWRGRGRGSGAIALDPRQRVRRSGLHTGPCRGPPRPRGTFPRSLIADLIDGRGIETPGTHGTRDMPIWGRVYREQSEAQTRGTPFPPEWSVRGRIAALVEYLQSVQQP